MKAMKGTALLMFGVVLMLTMAAFALDSNTTPPWKAFFAIAWAGVWLLIGIAVSQASRSGGEE